MPFDEPGGDSLRLLRFVFHLEQEYHITLPLDAFDPGLRPSAFAQRLEQCLTDHSPTRTEAGRRLFLVPGIGKDEPRLVRFRAACAPALRMVPIDYGDWPEWVVPGFDLTALIGRVAAAIEAEAPDGPVLLAGFSLGGEIAYAVAIALTGAGRTIGFFGILDTDIWRDETEPEPGALQRLVAAVRRGEGAERLASYASRPLTSLARPAQLRLVARLCRARLPGDFGFHLHRHIRRHLLARLVGAWWGQMPRPLPQLRVPAVLFRSTEHPADAPDDLGWREICPDLTVVRVDGGHNTMFDPPNLEPLSHRFTGAVPA